MSSSSRQSINCDARTSRKSLTHPVIIRDDLMCTDLVATFKMHMIESISKKRTGACHGE
jgi:hypothetical protein